MLGLCMFTFCLFSVTSQSDGSPAERPVTYRIEPAESRIEVEVGRAGFLKMFGHDHVIVASGLSGEARWQARDPESSRFTLVIDAASFAVADEGLSEEDRATVQSDMEDKALALADHPSIRFETETVRMRGSDDEAGAYRLELEGTLSLRGVERELRVPVNVTLAGETMTAEGELELESDAWGVPQVSVAGGTVKTKKELAVRFTITARR